MPYWATHYNSLFAVCTLVYWPFFYEAGLHPLDLQNLSGHALITFINIIDVFISNR